MLLNPACMLLLLMNANPDGASSLEGAGRPGLARVLLVEDDPDLGEMYSLGLRMAGHSVTVVPNGEDGLRIGLGGGFDLLLLDIRLPRLDGFGVLAALREQDGQLPVVILSNESGPEHKARASQLGAVDYLVKSETNPRQVAERVTRWLR